MHETTENRRPSDRQSCTCRHNAVLTAHFLMHFRDKQSCPAGLHTLLLFNMMCKDSAVEVVTRPGIDQP